jgi:hypothetical protein
MGLKHAGTVSAGALAFMAIAMGPSSAQERDRCDLGGLLCGVLRGLPGQPTPSPDRAARPKPRPEPDTENRRHDPPPRSIHVPPLKDHAPPIRRAAAAELPDISHQAPVVTPQRAPARLTAVAVPADESIPPFPVAAASCIIGALATVHMGVLSRRLRRRA